MKVNKGNNLVGKEDYLYDGEDKGVYPISEWIKYREE